MVTEIARSLIPTQSVEDTRSRFAEEERRHHTRELDLLTVLKIHGQQEVEPERRTLTFENVSFWYSRKNEPTLENISFHLPQGEILAFIGESGSGKTTIIRLVAGFETPQQGSITVNGQIVAGPKWIPPERRQVGTVFQDYALFPHLSITKNIAYGLRNFNRGKRRERVQELLELTGMTALAQKYPHELSGGQAQRVAIARALAPNPRILLLDEPFSNLDENRRQPVREEIRKIIEKSEVSVILVTHDLHDVTAMAHRAIEISAGRIVQ